MQTETTTSSHPFERRGLGVAPFRFVGMAQQDRCYGELILNRAEYEKTGIRITTKPGGTCDYCGQAIVLVFNVESSDGKRFTVGSDCVLKTADRAIVDPVKRAVNRATKAKRHEREAAKASELQALLDDETVQAKLAALPHPKAGTAPFFAGKTFADWVANVRRGAGASGKVRLLKAIRAVL